MAAPGRVAVPVFGPRALIAAVACLATAPALRAQTVMVPSWADSFVVVAPGRQYAKGSLYRAVFGAHNRDMWATPVRVPVLPLGRFAGGVTPLRAHI